MARFTIEIYDEQCPDGTMGSRINCSARADELQAENITDAGRTVLKIFDFLRTGLGDTATVYHARMSGTAKTGKPLTIDLMEEEGGNGQETG